jgi:hypothetical protein
VALLSNFGPPDVSAQRRGRNLRQMVDYGLPLTVRIAAPPSRQLEPDLDDRSLVGQVLPPANIYPIAQAAWGFSLPMKWNLSVIRLAIASW